MAFLGLDLGTSGLRGVLMDAQGRPVASAERPCHVSQPFPGWSEQDPADWIGALEGVLDEMRATCAGFRDLRAIGVAGHMHGATLLDAGGAVLRPCMLWNDTRARAEARLLDQTAGVRESSGNIVFAGFTAPKVQWVRHHQPEIFARIDKVLLPAAYLNLYLTGEPVSDMSDSAGTAWLDVGARDWSDRVLALTGLSRAQMPRLVEGAQPAGFLRPELARRWGLRDGVVIAGGAGDNAAAACGMGVLKDGQGFVSLGTSGVLLAARNGYQPAPETAVHTFCHAVPGRWVQMGVMLSATDSLNWLARITGQGAAALTGALGEDLAGPGLVRFLPYLSGERTPHNDTEIRGSFTGLSTATSQRDLTRAVLEGVAFGLRDSLEALKSADARLEQVFAIGGGAASRYWLKLIATVLDLPLALPSGAEFGAALGAARLAHAAATGEDPALVMPPPRIDTVIHPDPALTEAFNDAYQGFKAAYPAIRSVQ